MHRITKFGGDLAAGNPKGAQAGARVLKVQHRNLGDLPPRKRGQESDGTVVAARRGNARGAKGSCIKSVSNRKARSDLSEGHEHTHARNCKVAVKTVIGRLNKVLSGWARYFSVGYASRAFGKVNHYVLRRMARWLNRRSQRHYRLRHSSTYYGELQHLGLLRLRWADYRPARK